MFHRKIGYLIWGSRSGQESHRTYRKSADSKSYHERSQSPKSKLPEATFHIPQGNLVVLSGNRGSGKKTVLELMAGKVGTGVNWDMLGLRMRYVNLQLKNKSKVFQSDVGNYWVLMEGAQQVAVGWSLV